MAFRKFAADYIFTGLEMLGKNAVLITDETGKIVDLAETSDIRDGIERYNGILCPGFVNCHCHLELSHLRGVIPPHAGMIDFLLAVMGNRNKSDGPNAEAIHAEITYMREKGVVAVGDICNTADTIAPKLTSDLYFHNFIEALGVIPVGAKSRFGSAEILYEKFSSDMNANSIVPHAAYSVSEELLGLIDQFDKTAILTVHNQESEAEVKFMRSGKGDMLRLYHSLGIDVASARSVRDSSLRFVVERVNAMHSLILVHNCYTSKQDLEFLDEHRAELPKLWWCLCPNANLYIGNKLPDAALLKKMPDSIVVGTDSVASNTQLNILEELKALQQNFSWLTTEQLLKWATINGANALQINGRFGSFEKSKRPGVVVIHGGKGLSLDGTVSRRIL
jgi:cytosine/adenosine deaminase-related metal-dependent hydrolase